MKHLILAIALLLAAEGVSTSAERTYPPYPEVWDWVAPTGMENVGLRLQRLNDGDVLIVYEDRRSLRDNQRPVFSTKFFDQREPQRQVLPTNKSLVDGQQSYKATLTNGVTVRGSMGPGLRSSGCYDRLSGKVSITGPKGAGTTAKTLFHVFDRPRTWRVTPACRGMDGPEVFSYQVESIFAEILALEDTTFLVADSQHGVVIRFDTNFQTKSRLLNRRVFILDTGSFESFWSDNFRDDQLDKLQRALYEKLTSGKKEK